MEEAARAYRIYYAGIGRHFKRIYAHDPEMRKLVLAGLEAEIKTPAEIKPEDLEGYDLIGFGSGIYHDRHDDSLLALADKLPQATKKKAFISTDMRNWVRKWLTASFHV
jgi:menaquinone-dependent protoporphyrinogen IX oxidase